MPTLSRPRPWLVALALLAGVTGVQAAPAPDTGGRALSAKYLPDDTSLVIVVNVKQILASPLFVKQYKKQAQGLLGREEVRKWLKATGVDPLRDIDRVTFAMARSCFSDTGRADGPFIVIEGRFDPAKIKAAARQIAREQPRWVKEHAADDGTVYEVAAGPLVGLRGFAVMPDRNTLVFAPFRALALDALAKGTGKKKAALKYKDMRALLARMGPRQSVQFAVVKEAVSSVMSTSTKNGGQVVTSVEYRTFADEGVEQIRGEVEVADTVKGRGAITAKDADKAREIAQFLTRGVQEATKHLKQAVAQRQDLAPAVKVLEGLKVAANDRTVTLSGEAGAEAVQALVVGFFSSTAPAPPAGK